MNLALIGTLLMTGLLGSGHCLVMCGGINAALAGAMPGSATARRWQQYWMQSGRVLGYAAMGTAAASLGTGVFEASQLATVTRPLWIAGNVLALVAGLTLLIKARQPRWLDQFGYWLGERLGGLSPASQTSAGLRPATFAVPAGGASDEVHAISLASLRAAITAPGGLARLDASQVAPRPVGATATPVQSGARAANPGRLVALGAAWGLLPCGFLYSALMLVMISAEPLGGAAAMAAFAMGTAVPLILAQHWTSLIGAATPKGDGKTSRVSWRSWGPTLGARLLGGLMMAASLYGLYMLMMGDGYRLFCR